MIFWLLEIYKEGEMKLLTSFSLALNGSVWSASCYGHFTFGRKILHYAVDRNLRGLQVHVVVERETVVPAMK